MFVTSGSIKSLKFLKQLQELELPKHASPTLLRQRATPIIVGWFAGPHVEK
jgi:hypothetical protein